MGIASYSSEREVASSIILVVQLAGRKTVVQLARRKTATAREVTVVSTTMARPNVTSILEWRKWLAMDLAFLKSKIVIRD
jgi:hypothetical protein